MQQLFHPGRHEIRLIEELGKLFRTVFAHRSGLHHHYLVPPLIRFVEAYRTDDPLEALTHSIMGLERLLGGGATGDISYRLSMRVARIIGTDADKRERNV